MSDFKDLFIRQREAQSKWDYFFIGISFAFLLITFQAFSQIKSAGFEYLALISWLSMLTSAFSGLYRLRIVYSFMGIEVDNARVTETGSKTKEFTDYYEKQKTSLQNKMKYSATMQLILFGIGVMSYFLLICASIYPSFFNCIRASGN